MDRIPLDSKEHEILKTIERQGLNAKRIVEQLMGFARQRSTQEAFSDLNDNLHNVLLLVQNTLLTQKIDLDLDFALDLPKIKGGAGELQQVFLNLITNAIAAMPGGGKLTVASRFNPKEKVVEAIIADTGAGIPKEFVDRIFDPFFTTKKVGRGRDQGRLSAMPSWKNAAGISGLKPGPLMKTPAVQRHHFFCFIAARAFGGRESQNTGII